MAISPETVNAYLTRQMNFAAQVNPPAPAPPTPPLVTVGLTKYSLTPSPDGTNKVFTAPVALATGSLMTQNGLVLEAGGDYTYLGSMVTFVDAPLLTDGLALYQ